MRGAHGPRDGEASWGSPGTLSPGSRSRQPQCGPPVHPGLRPPPALAAGKAQGNFLQDVGCPWPGRVCRASGGALGGQTSPGPGEGAFLLPEPVGRGFPETRGAWPAARRESPGTSCLARGHRAATTIVRACPPRPPRPPSAQAPRPALQDADQTRPVPLLAGPGTARRPVSSAHCVHPRLPSWAICVRTRGPGACPPRKQRRAGDQGRVGVWPWVSLLATGWALWGGPHAARPAGSGDEITLRAGGSQVGTGTRPHPPGLAALGLGLAAPGHTETLLAWGRRGFRCRLQERGPHPAYPLL